MVTACQEAVAAIGSAVDAVKVECHVSRRQLRPEVVPTTWCRPSTPRKPSAAGKAHPHAGRKPPARRLPADAGGRFQAVLDQVIRWQSMPASSASRSSTRRARAGSTIRPRARRTRAWSTAFTIRARLPKLLVETIDTPLPVPVYFMRSVGSTAVRVLLESFISELAHTPGSISTLIGVTCSRTTRWRCACSMPRRRRRSGRSAALRHVRGIAYQLLHRARRPFPDLRRPGGRAPARRRPVRRRARGCSPSIPALRSIRTR